MSPPPDLRRLRDCLATAELRDAVNTAAAGRARDWAVVVPDGRGGLATVLSGRDPAGVVGEDAAATLAAILPDASDRLSAVPGGGSAAALRFRDETYGLFLLRGAAGAGDLAWWQAVVDALAPEIVKVQLYEAANRESATGAVKLDALHEAGELVRYVDLDVLLTKLMELSVRILRAEVGAIALVRDGELRAGIEWGLSGEILLSLATPAGEPFVASALERGEAVVIPDAAADDRVDVSRLPVRITSLVLMPLVTHGRRLGAIVVVNAGGDDGPRAEDVDVLRTAANLCAAAVDNAMLYAKTRAAERIAAEMNLAADIQNGLLPASHPENDAFEMLGWCLSASETGGDFYDFFPMDRGRTGIVIADATGHGMGAALLVFIARASLRALLTSSRDLSAVMGTLNDLVEADSAPDRFLTFLFGTFDPATRAFEFASAGHDPPFLYRPAEDRFLEFRPTGIPLGILAGARFPTTTVALQRGDLLLFGTDGIWEAADPEGRMLGKDRVRALLRALHARPLPELSERFREETLAYHAGGERRDDITAVFLRVK